MAQPTSTPGRPHLILIAAATAAAMASDTASACSCARKEPPGPAIEQADAVFTATAVDVPTRTRSESSFTFWMLSTVDDLLGTQLLIQARDRPVVFNVDNSWKGVDTTRTVIRTGFGGGDCGVPFVEGTRYLIYARLSFGELRTGICMRTIEAHLASEDFAALAKHERLTLRAAAPAYPLVVLAVVALLAAGLLAWRLRRNRLPARHLMILVAIACTAPMLTLPTTR